MKNTLRQVFHSPKFVVGFVIFVAILLLTIIYPMFVPGDPLQSVFIGTDRGSFAPPGTYFSLYDAVTSFRANLNNKTDIAAARSAISLSEEDKVRMINWFDGMGIGIDGLDPTDTSAMIELWKANYDESAKPKGMTKSDRNACKRLNALRLLKRGWKVSRETEKYVRLACYDSFDNREFLFINK